MYPVGTELNESPYADKNGAIQKEISVMRALKTEEFEYANNNKDEDNGNLFFIKRKLNVFLGTRVNTNRKISLII